MLPQNSLVVSNGHFKLTKPLQVVTVYPKAAQVGVAVQASAAFASCPDNAKTIAQPVSKISRFNIVFLLLIVA